jgi:hypothetical protein
MNLAELKAKTKELQDEAISLKANFIKAKEAEGWIHLITEGTEWEADGYGVNYLVSSKAFEHLFTFIKMYNGKPLEEAEGWWEKYKHYPPYVEEPLKQLKDYLKENHPTEILLLEGI